MNKFEIKSLKMIVIKNKIIPLGKKFYAINLLGIIFAKGDCDPVILNHEKIHSKQMKELFVLFFYILYVVEWVIRLFIYRDCYKAYRNISFEREAYSNQYNFSYPKSREKYKFINYISN